MATTIGPIPPIPVFSQGHRQEQADMSTVNLNVDTGQQHHQQYDQGNSAYGGANAYPTPVTGQSFRHQALAGAGEAGPSRRKNSAMQTEIDGMEHRARELRIDDAGDGRVGVEDPYGERSYTEVKCLGDGSFGTVWLCDWHSPVKKEVLLSAMQCGAGTRREWAGKRLVALKKMKRVWDGGWSEAKNLGELASLRSIPYHPAVIPLVDAYISPSTRQLYFVFECMEGNLYQLTKSRRGRPLAAGLVASCFHQISGGLDHIHTYGYFHRDMKPENLLVTTTGLTDYLTPEALNQINTQRGSSSGSDEPLPRTPNGDIQPRTEKDVSVIVKLADFGLARETSSKPPYTEYVSTRWYRAPEVLLRSRDYGAPVDMWAWGTILAEMVNLKPLFPGVSEIDQVYRVCEVLGDPSPDYGVDDRGRTVGGGTWNTGVKLAKNVGFAFPKRKPANFRALFSDRIPQSLVDCIADLLRYNPRHRLTAAQCVEHPYFHETLPHLQRTPPLPRIPFSQGQPTVIPQVVTPVELDVAPRQLPPSHSHHQEAPRPAFANGDTRILPPPVATPENMNRIFLPPGQYRPDMSAASTLVSQLRELDLPTDELASYGHRRPLPANEAFVNEHDQRSSPDHIAQTHLRNDQRSQAGYDGSVYEGSNPSLHHIQQAQQPTHQYDKHLPSHVAAYVQQQQQMALDPPSRPEEYIPPPIEPTRDATMPGPAPGGTIGKKKKWGLSSVFGGGDKSSSNLISASTAGFMSTTSLKRTQSGLHTDERSPSMPAAAVPGPPAPMPPLSDDPKKAKKEAAARAKELEMAKREAMARAQKERARAVMQKRNQMVDDRAASKSKADIEYGSQTQRVGGDLRSTSSAIPSASSASLHQQQHVNAGSSASLHRPHVPSRLAPSGHHASATASTPNFSSTQRTYVSMPPSASLSSIRSLDSGSHPSQSGQDQLSAEKLAAYDMSSRNKARRRENDYDHSESDHASLRSRSVLTIGTIDSDPGPRRAREHYPDPMIAAEARRHPSVSNLNNRHRSASRLTLGSNPSLESQLAYDFQRHASVANPPPISSASNTSLGRHGSSQFSLHGDIPPVPPVPPFHSQMEGGRGSAPPSPYGHPAQAAVAGGGGMGRHVLPGIQGWEAGDVNPMFRVPPAEGQSRGSNTTLPPFSAIASVADRHSPHPHSPQPHQ